MHDGVIIEYAHSSGDLSGFKTLAFTSAWELQYFLALGEFRLADALGISFWLVDRLVVIAALVLLVRQVRTLASTELGLPRSWAIAAAALVAVSPQWAMLVSSVHTIHVCLLAIGILGARMVYGEGRPTRVIGFAFTVVSFQFNSLLLFIPVLAYLMGVGRRWQTSHRYVPTVEAVLVFSAAVAYFALQRTLNPPTGTYAGYNSPLSSSEGTLLGSLAGHAVHFSTFLVLPGIGLSIALVCAMVARPQGRWRAPRSSALRAVIAAALLMLASVLPYILVGKSATVADVVDWTWRHAFALAPALALFTVSVVHAALDRLPVKRDAAAWIAAASIGVVLATQIFLLELGLATKLNRQAFERAMMTAASSALDAVPGGTLQIVASGLPGPWPSSYELNYALAESTGRSDRYARIAPEFDVNFTVPDSLTDGTLPPSAYAYDPSLAQCTSRLDVDAIGFTGLGPTLVNSLAQLLGRAPSSDHKVLVTAVKTDCPTR